MGKSQLPFKKIKIGFHNSEFLTKKIEFENPRYFIVQNHVQHTIEPACQRPRIHPLPPN